MKVKNFKFIALILAATLLCGIILPACGAENITVLFDVNCPSNVTIENEPDPVTVKKGDPVAEPDPAPIRSGYVFKGWFTDDQCTGDPYDFDTPVTENNFTLYAKWEVYVAKFTVTFDYSGKGTNSTIEVADGSTVTAPDVAHRDDAFFEGWYLEENGVTPYVDTVAITESIIIYAKWTTAYTVNFNLNGGTSAAIPAQKLRENTVAEWPANPSRDSYAFAGWYTEAACANAYVFAPIAANATVYAKWVSASGTKYTVTFNLNGEAGTATPSQEIVSGAVINEPRPTHAAYQFAGWYTDAACTVKYNSNTPVTAAITLYAKWIMPYRITFDYNYTGAPAARVIEILEGGTLTAPANPSRTGGYTFAGWSTEAASSTLDATFGGTVTAAATFYAQWNFTMVHEAEDVDLERGHNTVDGIIQGWGWSGTMYGLDLIHADDTLNKTASGKSYIYGIMAEGATLTFNIQSDRAVSNASFTVRLSAEIFDTLLHSGDTAPANAANYFTDSTRKAEDGINYEFKTGKYTFMVNGTAVQYNPIALKNVPTMDKSYKRDFEDITLGNISLNQGTNVIKLITDNNRSIGGTTTALAPLVDCIKITTYAKLTKV